jgi:HSP20 family protein
MIFERTRPQHDDADITVLPPVNIYEQAQDIILSLEMPGVDRDSLDVSLNGDNLSIKGRTRREVLDKKYSALLQERVPVEFTRSFQLTTETDRDKISAEYTAGILNVTLPKSPAVQPKKIEITN